MAKLDKRVQLLLSEDEWKELAFLAKKEEQSVGHLIREAVAQVYGVGDEADQSTKRRSIIDKWSKMDLAVDDWDVMEQELADRYESHP